MDKEILVNGYKKVLSTIYSPKSYYARIKTLLKEYKPLKVRTTKLRLYHIRALISSIWLLGIKQKGRRYFWKLLLWCLVRKPGMFSYAVGFSFIGLHFRTLAVV